MITPASIMGHRGVPSLAPENTLSGFRKLHELGVTWVELDVTLLGDHTPIVHHDDSFDRCCNISGALRDFGRDDLKQINAAARFPELPPESPPTLAEVALLLKQQGTGLNLEMKRHGFSARDMAVTAIDTLQKAAFPSEQLILSSFDFETLAECKQYAPHLARGLIFDTLPSDWEILAKEIGAFSIHCDWQSLNYRQVRAVKDAGYQLYCWTANSPAAVTSLWQWGIDGVMSDRPQDFLSVPL